MTSILRANDDSIQCLAEQFLMAGEPGHAKLFSECSSFIRVFMRESDEFDSRNRFEIGLVACGVQMSNTENSDAHKTIQTVRTVVRDGRTPLDHGLQPWRRRTQRMRVAKHRFH